MKKNQIDDKEKRNIYQRERRETALIFKVVCII